MINLSLYRHTSWGITACACALIALGLLFIYSGSYQMGKDAGSVYVMRQAAWGLAGILVAGLLVMLDYRKLAASAFLIYGVFIVLLILLLFGQFGLRGSSSSRGFD